MLWEVWRYASKGWIKRFWIDPSFHFQYYGFSWIEPWAGDGMYWHFVALGICAALITIGLAYRLAAVLFFLGFSYVFLLDQATYLNHFYLIVLLSGIAIFLSPHRAWSIDSLLAPLRRRTWAPCWQLGLLRLQIGIVYVFAGVAKLNADWLAGSPMKLWLPEAASKLGARESWLATDTAAHLASFGGLAFDLLIVPALLWRRTRVVAFAAAVAFHLANAWLFSIGVFPFLMIALTVMFFPVDAWNRRLPWVRRGDQKNWPDAAPALRPVAWCMLTLYLGLQLAVPLRHWLYPGDVAWTEEGHRFSWRMKLRDKSGQIRFSAVSPDGAPTRWFEPADYLNRHQTRELATRPDLILQFAHHLGAELAREGASSSALYAHSRVRLNGRPALAMIDPTVDLSRERRSLRPAKWILSPEQQPSIERIRASLN